jgi:predicted N-acetyltransferase YhbS
VATDSACAVIGQVALVDAGRNRPAAGIADLVVDSERRGQGVGSALLDAALESPLARRAEAVFAASAHPGVRHHLRRRGFRPARPFELYWVARDGCHRNPDWVVRRASSGALEVIGDV